MAMLDDETPGAHHLQRLQRRGIRRDRAFASSSAATSSWSSKVLSELPLIARSPARNNIRARIGIRAQAIDARLGPLGSLGRRSQQVRPVVREMLEPCASCARRTCSTASSCSTSTSAARSRRSARQNAMREAGASSSSCAGWARRCVPRRGRRPGGVDYDGRRPTSLVDELHDAGVRQRRRVHHGAVRRGRHRPPNHRVGVGPRGGRAPRDAGVDVLGVSEFDVGRARGGCPRHARRWCATCTRRSATSRARTSWRPTTTPSSTKTVLTLFSLGHLSLEQRVSPRISSGRCARRSCASRASRMTCPKSSKALERALSDTYFCNFSMFQSLPDSWAIDQLFPDHAHPPPGEEPTRRGGAGRHHLRQRRQDRSVHRPAT